MAKLPLFVYAELEGKNYPKAAVPGILRKRGKDGAAQFKSGSSTLVHGELREDEEKNYPKLDDVEKPQYSRVRVTTTSGQKAYAYEYIEKDFGELPLISSGHYSKK